MDSPISGNQRERFRGMIDAFGRRVTYLRVSVTDRCDLRCVYCMAEHMSFLPKADVLSLEELGRVCEAFIGLGVRKIRLTGGEPLVRANILSLIQKLGRHVAAGALDELTLTTNATQLARHAADLAAAGVRRLNVSLDTLDPDRFRAITRTGDLAKVIEGLDAADAAGLAVKINAVAMRGVNDDEFDALVAWCGRRGYDLTFIETMPMGEVAEDRTNRYLPLSEVRERLAAKWTLAESGHRTAGPSRYLDVVETGARVGFIAPMSHGFCESCNRVRVTCTGTLYTCLGHEQAIDLRAPLRASPDDAALIEAIGRAISCKPKGHDFVIGRDRRPTIARHMSVTGG